jgi:hypothetical protein
MLYYFIYFLLLNKYNLFRLYAGLEKQLVHCVQCRKAGWPAPVTMNFHGGKEELPTPGDIADPFIQKHLQLIRRIKKNKSQIATEVQ